MYGLVVLLLKWDAFRIWFILIGFGFSSIHTLKTVQFGELQDLKMISECMNKECGLDNIACSPW